MSNWGLDHFVLTVRDIAKTTTFYERALGVESLTFGARHALAIGDQKINLHTVSGVPRLRARRPMRGSGDFCLRTTTPLDDLAERVRGVGAKIVAGPVPRAGARGRLRSIYLYDPDGNLVEVANEETEGE